MSQAENGVTQLRQLRAEAALTQEQLADLAGIHVRTVRGLESGRITAPHRSTVESLARALGLDVTARIHLLEGCGLVAAGPPLEHADPPVERVSGNTGEDLIAAFMARSAATMLPVSVTEQITIGPDRRTRVRRTEEVAVALEGGVTNRHVFFAPEEPVDPDEVHLSEVDNAKVARELVISDGQAKIFVVAFGRPLNKGETHVLRYSIDLSKAFLPRDTRPADGRAIGGFLRSPASYLLEVRFVGDALPRRLAQVFQASPSGRTRVIRHLEVDPRHGAHISLVNPKPGGHGIVWRW